MEITEDEVQYLITTIAQAQQDLHSEYCYTNHCSCDNYHKAIVMLQKKQSKQEEVDKPKSCPTCISDKNCVDANICGYHKTMWIAK
jgi:hypothetical protein